MGGLSVRPEKPLPVGLYRNHIFHCYTSPTVRGFFGWTIGTTRKTFSSETLYKPYLYSIGIQVQL